MAKITKLKPRRLTAGPRKDASRPLIIRAIDLDQCDWIAIRIVCKRKKAYSQRPRSVIVSEAPCGA
jgi:hypothetical protein